MKKKNITTITANSLEEILQGKTDWKRIDAMTEEEAHQNALNDLDAPPLFLRKDLQPTVDVKLIRAKMNMTQQEFAKKFIFRCLLYEIGSRGEFDRIRQQEHC